MEVRVHPHPTGDWLVILGGRRLAVPPRLGVRLQTLDGGQATAAELGASCGCGSLAPLLARPPRRRRRGPWWTLPLLPGERVRQVAKLLVPLVSTPGLVLLAVLGTAGAVFGHGAPAPGWSWEIRAAGVVVFMLTALLHELGHAAALQRGGYPPGGMGLGMVLVLPVLWCDVSAVSLLPRRDRLRVDLAGPAVQLAAAGALAVLGRLSPFPAGAVAQVASAVALAAVAWSLLPFVRSDGFWFLGDLSGLGDLDREPWQDEPRGAALALGAYRVLHAGFLLLVGGGLAWRLTGTGRTAWSLAGGVLAVATLVLVGRRLAGLRRFLHKPDAPAPPPR